MAFIPEVATGFGKFAFGVAVPVGADEAARVQALKANANTTIKTRTIFLLIFFLLLHEMGGVCAQVDDFI
jgi:hypothetical protein